MMPHARLLLVIGLAGGLVCTAPAASAAETAAQSPSNARGDDGAPPPEIKKLFAAQCGWCHGDYGKKADKGPQLAGTPMTQQQVHDRIRDGKQGVMPSFRKVLSDEQITAFASYIKALKPGD
jgi:mono/diheme cytochrome c family protein